MQIYKYEVTIQSLFRLNLNKIFIRLIYLRLDIKKSRSFGEI